MGKPIESLLSTLLLLASPLCYGHIHTVVSHPVLEVNEQEVHIFYDIINSSPNDRFDISVLITGPLAAYDCVAASVQGVKNEPAIKSNER